MKHSRWLKLGLLLLVVVGVAWGGLAALGLRVTDITPDNVRGFVLSFGALAPLIYLAAYGQPIVPLPASVMTITGGLAFGPIWGTLAALTGATIRACSQFLVARLLGRKAVEKLLKGGVANLNQRLGDNSFKAVLLIRIIPNFPFDVQNYGLGFSRVRFAPYFLGTVLGMPLGAFV
ncbi:MAG: TVP38/TMEM64 family protein, partial [Candidatus Omnitrophica bacterium]|nr:TVP38/TMEM64 family protein [Candidatus Omnitrophota bacterium]